MNHKPGREYPSLSRSLLTMARASVALLSDRLTTLVRREQLRLGRSAEPRALLDRQISEAGSAGQMTAAQQNFRDVAGRSDQPMTSSLSRAVSRTSVPLPQPISTGTSQRR